MNFKILLIILLTVFVSFSTVSQVETHKAAEIGIPKIFIEVLGFASDVPNESRLDVYIQVPYDAIFFVKNADIFLSNYELTVNIYDVSNNLVKEKLWNESIKTSTYEETVSPKLNKLSQQSFPLPPGAYRLVVQIRDIETKKAAKFSRNVELRDFRQQQFTVSDVMLLSKLTIEGEKKIIIPNISGNVVDLGEGFFAFAEVYNSTNADSVEIVFEISKDKKKTLRTGKETQPLVKGKNSLFFKINSGDLPMGDYTLEIKMNPNLQQITTSISRKFSIYWRGMPVSIVDLDAAIDQMTYIEQASEIARIKKLPFNERLESFKEFWKKKDPTPNTERNELMEEYYSRVEYANKNFKHYIAGWKTDMGMVFIVFGTPNNVDRHPFDIDSKPYEVWYYYELNRQFVFVDQTGFGDYQLTTPIWDVWQRPR